MKTLLLLFFLSVTVTAQDRYLESPRQFAVRLPPQLMEGAGVTANGIAQAPNGEPAFIVGFNRIPAGSIIGLYGSMLQRNDVAEVLIMANGKEYALAVDVYSQVFPNLEMVVFRLPSAVTGEVWVRAAGLRESNFVRFFVEEK